MSSTVGREAPVWFWIIVAFQVRGMVIVMLAYPLNDVDALALLGDNLIHDVLSVMMGIPALLMVGAYSLRLSWPQLLRVTLVGMVVASLGDVVLQAGALLSHGRVDDVEYTHVFLIVLDGVSAGCLVGSRRLRQVFWARQWRWY